MIVISLSYTRSMVMHKYIAVAILTLAATSANAFDGKALGTAYVTGYAAVVGASVNQALAHVKATPPGQVVTYTVRGTAAAAGTSLGLGVAVGYTAYQLYELHGLVSEYGYRNSYELIKSELLE